MKKAAIFVFSLLLLLFYPAKVKSQVLDYPQPATSKIQVQEQTRENPNTNQDQISAPSPTVYPKVQESRDAQSGHWIYWWWKIGFWSGVIWIFPWVFIGTQWSRRKFWGFAWPWPWWFWIPIFWWIPWLIIGWKWWLVWWGWWVWGWWIFPWIFWIFWWLIVFKEAIIWIWKKK